ncbi:MAG: efflux RND transporter periplasmic adaptor subunit [Chromatiales bacterium]|nr:MAG: efflux RND transporter periplasmic adaptor subunit [Chromatiales bacterium]
MKASLTIAGLAVLATAAGGVYWGRGGLESADDAGIVTTFVSPERRTIASTVLATGILRLKTGAEVRVGSQLSGIVEELNVTVGSQIERGDIIARIDSRGLEARLAQAEAQIEVLEREVSRAEVELARARQLDQDKLVARTEVEDRTLDLIDAKARLEKARRDAAVVETDLAYAVIRAPISGTVASVTTQEGETVAASFTTPTFVTIIDRQALELVAMVDETDIGAVAPGNDTLFTVEAFPADEFTGTVKQVAPKGTIISGVVNYEVMIDIASPVTVLRPDMTANVSIRTAERETLVLPSRAIQRDGFERFVYVQSDGELRRRTVTVGTRDAGFTEIRQGLADGDRVLLEPLPEKVEQPS